MSFRAPDCGSGTSHSLRIGHFTQQLPFILLNRWVLLEICWDLPLTQPNILQSGSATTLTLLTHECGQHGCPGQASSAGAGAKPARPSPHRGRIGSTEDFTFIITGKCQLVGFSPEPAESILNLDSVC